MAHQVAATESDSEDAAVDMDVDGGAARAQVQARAARSRELTAKLCCAFSHHQFTPAALGSREGSLPQK
eukprot:7123859-Alexandrium_andersonii.AAC.1